MEEKEEFQLRLDLKSEDPEITEYLADLHNYLLNWEASSIKNMLLSLDETASEIAKDLQMINRGEAFTPAYVVNTPDGGSIAFPEVCKLKVLNDSKDSKVYDRVLALVGKVKDFRSVCELAESMRPEIRKEQTKKKTLKIDPTKNIMEQISKATQ